MHLFAKLCKLFQNTIVHIHYKEIHIWKVMHFFSKSHSFFKIYIQLLPFYSSLLASSSLRYHSLLDPQVLYASSADGLTFTAVPFCLCPMSATGLGTQEQSFSQLLFSACVLVIIPHTQGSLNMCLLTVTLVAVFMH